MRIDVQELDSDSESEPEIISKVDIREIDEVENNLDWYDYFVSGEYHISKLVPGISNSIHELENPGNITAEIVHPPIPPKQMYLPGPPIPGEPVFEEDPDSFLIPSHNKSPTNQSNTFVTSLINKGIKRLSSGICFEEPLHDYSLSAFLNQYKIHIMQNDLQDLESIPYMRLYRYCKQFSPYEGTIYSHALFWKSDFINENHPIARQFKRKLAFERIQLIIKIGKLLDICGIRTRSPLDVMSLRILSIKKEQASKVLGKWMAFAFSRKVEDVRVQWVQEAELNVAMNDMISGVELYDSLDSLEKEPIELDKLEMKIEESHETFKNTIDKYRILVKDDFDTKYGQMTDRYGVRKVEWFDTRFAIDDMIVANKKFITPRNYLTLEECKRMLRESVDVKPFLLEKVSGEDNLVRPYSALT
jgi:hypothetical protein